ncbi:Uma2 family endonuclease [Haliscomenobacter sp.]|jgi:Uma2 family endonuclease|uniref:Uma2 family endonuclease n=1 Tax=Haliscomenobacter sp. TaxID=2717303 RepID=UPI003364F78F
MLLASEEHQIATILESPSAPLVVNKLMAALEDEKRRRQEFYRDVDDDMKVEFINGEIIVHSPVKKEHTDATGFLYQLLNVFVRVHKLGYVGYEKVLTALTRNDYEPDVVFFGTEKAASFKKGHWKYPAPDFVVEVLSDSTAHRDRGIKFNDYAAHGVEEYWIIDPEDETIEQYFIQDEQYKLHLKIGEGIIRSKVVSGFAIEVRAVFEEAVHLETLKKILNPDA